MATAVPRPAGAGSIRPSCSAPPGRWPQRASVLGIVDTPTIGTLVDLTTGGGFADVKAGALWRLGWYGWTTVRDGTTVALLLAASYVLARLVSRRGSRNGQVALGPILLLAGCLVRLLVVA